MNVQLLMDDWNIVRRRVLCDSIHNEKVIVYIALSQFIPSEKEFQCNSINQNYFCYPMQTPIKCTNKIFSVFYFKYIWYVTFPNTFSFHPTVINQKQFSKRDYPREEPFFRSEDCAKHFNSS